MTAGEMHFHCSSSIVLYQETSINYISTSNPTGHFPNMNTSRSTDQLEYYIQQPMLRAVYRLPTQRQKFTLDVNACYFQT